MKSTKYIPGFECKFSFDDLYKAAYGKNLDIRKKQKLQKLSQIEINRLVEAWALKANWLVQEKVGREGKAFLAFHPKSAEDSNLYKDEE